MFERSMTYQEQCKWLINNGFAEVQCLQENMHLWTKSLEYDRHLNFTWYNGIRKLLSIGWTIDIAEPTDSYMDVNNIFLFETPHDYDFTLLQPLIDLVK